MRITKIWILLLCVGVLLTWGCSHKTLSIFFDGVPNPDKAKGPGVQPQDIRAANPRISFSEHGPYASKNCSACHNRQENNNLVLPKEQLCYTCHEFSQKKKYIHGPLLQGGCLVCHDPHSSPYRSLLKSESDTFCFYCHDQASILRNPAHKDTTSECTTCHDAHMSDKQFLLK